jgi:hypothetical protein
MFAQIGDYVKPDGWKNGELLEEDCGYKDSSFPGCQFRLPNSHEGYKLAVNITVTGRKPNKDGYHRCKIEFVGDGEPSTFCGGWIKLK